MNIIKQSSPNYDHHEIPVDFLVLHYTAVDLEETLAVFMDPQRFVSSHLVIDRDGTVYEMVDCLNGAALRARHAGISRWQHDSVQLEAFNDFSIGIELINYNGNVFTYTEAQYSALSEVIERLQQHYPALLDPNKVVGHEHIAGFRGKADPGQCFDWPHFYKAVFPKSSPPIRQAICPSELQARLYNFKHHAPSERKACSLYWQSVSEITETAIALMHQPC